MLIVHVYAQVKPEHVEAFKKACLANARESLKEPGVARFDVVQEVEDPTRFALLEVYRTEADPPRHKDTDHYARWRETVEGMLVAPRTRTIYRNLAPDDAGWETPGAAG
jgi:(4S)-4-hydroxy-5-phosphonooxypentane-2,3-dione isomerase